MFVVSGGPGERKESCTTAQPPSRVQSHGPNIKMRGSRGSTLQNTSAASRVPKLRWCKILSMHRIRKTNRQFFDKSMFSIFLFALTPFTKHELPSSEGSAQPAKASAQSTRGRQEQLAARTWQTLSADACGHNTLFPVRAFPFPGISKARSHLIATVCFSIQCVAFYCLDNVL